MTSELGGNMNEMWIANKGAGDAFTVEADIWEAASVVLDGEALLAVQNCVGLLRDAAAAYYAEADAILDDAA